MQYISTSEIMAGFNRFKKKNHKKIWPNNFAFSLKTKQTQSNNKKPCGRKTKTTLEETTVLEIKTSNFSNHFKLWCLGQGIGGVYFRLAMQIKIPLEKWKICPKRNRIRKLRTSTDGKEPLGQLSKIKMHFFWWKKSGFTVFSWVQYMDQLSSIWKEIAHLRKSSSAGVCWWWGI